jgi:hypothetical protein
MKLYVANTTKQRLHFRYRLGSRPFDRVIPIGVNIPIHSDNLDDDQAREIIKQLEIAYNAIDSKSPQRRAGFVGVCYSLTDPVRPPLIADTVEHNDEVLTERGEQIRKEAAVAVDAAMENGGARPDDLKKTTVSVVEETERGAAPGTDEEIVVEKSTKARGGKR